MANEIQIALSELDRSVLQVLVLRGDLVGVTTAALGMMAEYGVEGLSFVRENGTKVTLTFEEPDEQEGAR